MEGDRMGCSEDKTILLSKYVDNELTDDERRRIEDHLAEWNCVIRTTTHRFQVGPKTENRPKLLEALLIKPGYQCAKKPEV